MIAFHPTDRNIPRLDTRRLFIETFRRQISGLEQGRARFRIPQTRHLYERHPQMAYHFKPELFIQLGGTTDFFFPDQRFTLEPGEICVMPKGVPHGEIAHSGPRPFENVVVCYYNDTVAIHVAHESPPGRPIVDDIFFFTTNLYPELVEYLNRMCELRFHQGPARETAVKGLLLAELALLLSVVDERESQLYSETERVSRCQWLIRNNIDSPELNVESLAAELRCSPDHLAKLFHEQTSERIVEYITRVRLHCALDAMQHTLLSVKEIAAACGFSDPNYFTRVFRKLTGRSPVKYRRDLQRLASATENEPKVVYFDREEHDFGLRPDVMAKAKARVLPNSAQPDGPSTSTAS
jgi:AraC-like DNA-binding protein/mannose-6-phosphate isomerase-like protein (cupin superfamily)